LIIHVRRNARSSDDADLGRQFSLVQRTLQFTLSDQ